jgi:transcription antitermination factor NusG
MAAPHVLDTASNGEQHWWAIYTRHQHEKVIADVLSAKGFEVFLPLYDSIRRWKDRQKLLSLPLFPCYVFVRGGLNRRFQILSTPGVHMALTRGDQIAVIPEKEIAAIRRTMDGPFRMEPHPFLRCGESVRVVRGSLEGVEGILIRKKNQFRLVLSVDMLAKSVAVEIDAADVESIAEPVLSGQAPAGFYRSYRPAQGWRGHWASTELDIRVVGS